MQKNMFNRIRFRFSAFLVAGLLITLAGCTGSTAPPPSGSTTPDVRPGATTVAPAADPT